jgi:hypothetical protein
MFVLFKVIKFKVQKLRSSLLFKVYNIQLLVSLMFALRGFKTLGWLSFLLMIWGDTLCFFKEIPFQKTEGVTPLHLF